MMLQPLAPSSSCLLPVSKHISNNFLKLHKQLTNSELALNSKRNAVQWSPELWIKPEVTSRDVTLDLNRSFGFHIDVKNIIFTPETSLGFSCCWARKILKSSFMPSWPKKTKTKKKNKQVQLILNPIAGIFTEKVERAHIPVVAMPHWLSVTFRIEFEVLLQTYKAVSISDTVVNKYVSSRALRPSAAALLEVASSSRQKLGMQLLQIIPPNCGAHSSKRTGYSYVTFRHYQVLLLAPGTCSPDQFWPPVGKKFGEQLLKSKNAEHMRERKKMQSRQL